ncbi:hypothetical protein ACFSDX_15010 [Hymenobacter bucti]|uniref:Uncharacterized protein n=1 Tax=Hymenobacter bucti TaxID=1844114 RepID=A0ABW4QWH8_9BACT
MSDERTPRPSPGTPTELQQLEAALAAGVITPELFATLSAQLRAAGPVAPVAPAAPEQATTSAPSSSEEELPSLLAMFDQPPAVPARPPVPPASASPARPPAPLPEPPTPASPARASAADAAARQRIEEHLAQMRQQPAAEPTPPKPTPAPPPNFYSEPATPNFYPPHPLVEAASPPPARPAAAPKASAPPAEPTAGGAGRWLWVLLLGLAVAGALAYFFTQASHPDESLTSPTLPAAEPAPTEAAAPKPAAKSKKSTKKKRKTKAVTPVAATSEAEATPEEETATSPPTTATATATAATSPASAAPAASRSIPAAPEASDDAATTKVREVLAAYYADLYAPPLHADQHFAPQVERLYIQQNLTPAAIDAELARSFFPDNQQAVAQIEPGTLRVSTPAADGSRTATFTETMRLYRVSLRKNQQLRTKVRVRFNADYQIAYMRQEKLLANTFE